MSKRYQAGILTASYNGLKVPNAPTIGTATAGAGSASVTFTAPSDVGGGAITSYTVISSPGSITGTGSSSPVTVSGLTNGTAYTFTVVATNAYGTGPASAASNSVTPSLNYIEDVFSTYLYSSSGSFPTPLVNGIDLAGKGGLIWAKSRNVVAGNITVDTVTAPSGNYFLQTDTTAALANATSYSYNSNGYTFQADLANFGTAGQYNFVSWTFRKQPKFFDVVTYTGTGSATTISHNLGSVPGCIIVKRIDSSGFDWAVYHTSTGNTQRLLLNTTDPAGTSSSFWNNTTPTSAVFTVGTNVNVNASGGSYVAYLFAHNAGGFGLSGSDNVISCGSYTGNGSATAGTTVNLGYEPQWLLVKLASAAGENWTLYDTMRGMPVVSTDSALTTPLFANTVDAQLNGYSISPQSTGFRCNSSHVSVNGNGQTYIYIAIRRGPMKVPTSGTSVFSPNAVTMTASGSATITTNFPVDLSFNRKRSTADQYVMDRLRGGSQTSYNYLRTQTTGAETTGSTIGVGFDSNTSLVDNNWLSGVSANTIWWSFQRAPSFFDEVCYTGTGSATTVTHNLGVVPELMIVKKRNAATAWAAYSATLGNTKVLFLDKTDSASVTSTPWNDTSPTASVFTVGTSTTTNASAATYVAYLFATCAGVSKVGSYTGTGATQTISCGFTGGARFVLIKRTDSTGNWYVWDTARGMVSGTDPSLLLNSTAAEADTDDVYTTTGGFQIVSTAAGINASGGTYIYLAIA